MGMRILRLNKSGLPIAWVTREEAATLYVKEQVLWFLGEESERIVGGINRHGVRSVIDMAPIIACDGQISHYGFVPALSNRLLFRRDDHRCMYCGLEFEHYELTRDHVSPRVQGGDDRWTNVVTACKRCNHHKGGQTPEQADMQLLAVPFEPNVFEFMYLSNHQIRGDQMDYLAARFSGRRSWAA